MTGLRREELIQALPYARRYARALTGSQARGDQLVAQSLKAVLATGLTLGTPEQTLATRLELYASVTRHADQVLSTSGSGLTLKHRQLLLLTALEDMRIEEAAAVVGQSAADCRALLDHAREHLRSAAATDVLIIEDEPIIAMDIEELVAGCGHRVVGVAATEADAVAIAARTRPGLILADINLGAGGDGSNAVARILQHLDAPVIFVTAYPERLLTGDTLEPAFIITKPFEPLTLAIATYQAVTGGVQLD